MENKKIELLAPAGNLEAFWGAINAGADAIYLGGSQYGARAYADNFTAEELVSCIRIAHIYGRKIYLTVNTLLKEKEFEHLYEYILPFYKAGLDGVIIQDVGVFQYIKHYFPGIELHVSTQMTITGSYGAKMLKDMGASRIVPARELSLYEINEIKNDSGLELETFIHGAMCYCYSGMCLFSSILGGRSGNRGRCAQPCRLPYRVSDNQNNTSKNSKDTFPLSLKDMCTIEHLPELLDSGIDSFKIEGRMKKPEYAAGVTAIYRKYMDKIYYNPEAPFNVDKKDNLALSKLYIRSGIQDGYYFKHNGAEMITLDNPAYSEVDETLLNEIRTTNLITKKKIIIDISAEFILGQPAKVIFSCNNLRVQMEGQTVSHAENRPLTEENIKKQLTKLGETLFDVNKVHIVMSDNIFYSLKELNELRRLCAAQLEDKLIEENGRPICRDENVIGQRFMKQEVLKSSLISSHVKQIVKSSGFESAFSVMISSQEQLNCLMEYIKRKNLLVIDRIYIEMDLLISMEQNLNKVTILAEEYKVYGVLPYVLRNYDLKYLEKVMLLLEQLEFSGCMVRSIEGYAFLKESQFKGDIETDYTIYVWNKGAIEFWQSRVDSICLPLELNAGEWKNLIKGNESASFEKLLYGRIPMMITANCASKTTNKCKKNMTQDLQNIKTVENIESNMESMFLTDRYQKKFPVSLNCRHCYNVIYNSVPLSLHKEYKKWNGIRKRISFSVEKKEEMILILEYFRKLESGENTAEFPLEEYTTGHEKRGVD